MEKYLNEWERQYYLNKLTRKFPEYISLLKSLDDVTLMNIYESDYQESYIIELL